MIDRSTIERILDAAQIVDVVQEFVPLMKKHLLSPFLLQKRSSNALAAERLATL